jgi:hypothetical protein
MTRLISNRSVIDARWYSGVVVADQPEPPAPEDTSDTAVVPSWKARPLPSACPRATTTARMNRPRCHPPSRPLSVCGPPASVAPSPNANGADGQCPSRPLPRLRPPCA